ncbi:SWI2/SNF2 ISWI-like (AT hook) [Toxoplasma gondii TgCatPRC2]|uniref:SWI2/SNF2 ISWI-like (AT hook) n=1 Tax=Toxoplasma gondii TgCatPRC2 TaxID=1130821 RepID=A0A151HPU1_TOXGO|nr:SWI2/SNF2 ISWI-like (AT hook) [Toxoplasma gondii TgCatPRC2]
MNTATESSSPPEGEKEKSAASVDVSVAANKPGSVESELSSDRRINVDDLSPGNKPTGDGQETPEAEEEEEDEEEEKEDEEEEGLREGEDETHTFTQAERHSGEYGLANAELEAKLRELLRQADTFSSRIHGGGNAAAPPKKGPGSRVGHEKAVKKQVLSSSSHPIRVTPPFCVVLPLSSAQVRTFVEAVAKTRRTIS